MKRCQSGFKVLVQHSILVNPGTKELHMGQYRRLKQEKGTATVLNVRHVEAPLRTQRHACHN